MSDEWFFRTPADVDADLPEAVRQAWHDNLSTLAGDDVMKMQAMLPPEDRERVPYVNPVLGEVPQKRTTVSVPWEGFPARVTAQFGSGDAAFREVEHLGSEDFGGIFDQDGRKLSWPVRDRQDEYLEWFAREEDGKLVSVTFVAEAYDYWAFLFDSGEHQRVADCYAERTSHPQLKPDDLRAPSDLFVQTRRGFARFVKKGDFNPRNPINHTGGIVHLSHKANSLTAEISLAVTSAIPRVDASARLVTADIPKRLLCCTQGGEPNRSSDALIAAGAYAKVSDSNEPMLFTLTNPVGLYIKSFAHDALRLPNRESAPREWWHVERGRDASDPLEPTDSRILRLRVEVPRSENLTLSDLTIDDQHPRFAGEFTKLIKMHLMVDAWPAPGPAPQIRCSGGCCRIDDLLVTHDVSEACPPGTEAFPGLDGSVGLVGEPRGLIGRRAL